MEKVFYKKNRFYGNHLPVVMLLCVLAIFGAVQKVQAAKPGIAELDIYSSSKCSYSRYDVTGDGVADTVKVKVINNRDEMYSGTMKVYVNNIMVFEQTREPDPVWHINLIRLKNGKVFFNIQSTILSNDAAIHNLYVCQNNQLKSVYDFQKYYENYASYYTVRVTSVSGNTIKTEVGGQFYTTGAISYDMNVVYKGGKFKRTANIFRPKYEARENKWTAGRKIKVYKKVGSKKIAYTLKKGNVVTLDKIVYKNNKVYFQVKRSTGKVKTGYIPVAKKWVYPQYFEEAQFAG